MKAGIYVRLAVDPDGFCSIRNLRRDVKFSEEEIEEEYEYKKSLRESIPEPYRKRLPPFDEFRAEFIKVTVKFDGRKDIYKEDIMEALEKVGIVRRVPGGWEYFDYKSR